MSTRLIKSNGYWWIDGRVMGERVRKSTRLPDTQPYKPMAEAMRAQIEHDMITGAAKKPKSATTFGDAQDGYLTLRTVEGRCNKDMLDAAARWRKDWEHIKLNEITTAALQSYVSTRWHNLEPGTVKRYLSAVSAVMGWAEENIKDFRRIKMPSIRVDDARDCHFDEGQAVDFLEWVKVEHPHYFPHFLTLIDTGVRSNELLNLTPSCFSDGVVRVRKKPGVRKTKTLTRDIPMTADLQEFADTFKRKNAYDRFFWHNGATGREWTSNIAFSTTLNRVLREGCEKIGATFEGGATLRVHDLRHTFAYLTAKAGADLGDLQYLMGHADLSMTMRYRGFIQSRARTYVTSARRQLDVSGPYLVIPTAE